MDTFGQRLVASREVHGLSQKELAEQLGITPTRLNYWEKDKREPAIEMIKLIAQVLDVDTNYLIGYQPQNIKASSTAEAASGDEQDALRSTLLYNFDQLNQEGKEKLVDLSDDMVATGKYIKSDQNRLGETKNA